MNIEIVSEELMIDIKDIEKNGCKLRALRIPVSHGIEALVYEDAINRCKDIAEVIAVIDEVKLSRAINKDDIQVKFSDPDWLYANVRMFVQKNKPADGIKYLDFADLYVVYYIRIDKESSCLLTEELEAVIKKKYKGIYVKALENSRPYTTKHVADLLHEKFGLPAPSETLKAQFPMHYLGNKDGYRGSSALADSATLEKMCDRYDVKYLLIFPSSVHELLFIPEAKYPSKADMENYSEMVNDINSKEVAPDEILSDHPYVYTKGEGLTW